MLLHFQEVNAAQDRKVLFEKLVEHVQAIQGKLQFPSYDKAAFPFELLENAGNEIEAIKRAERILDVAREQNPKDPWTINPTTEVHLLIRELRKFTSD